MLFAQNVTIILLILVKLLNDLCFFTRGPSWEHCSQDGHHWFTRRTPRIFPLESMKNNGPKTDTLGQQ